MNIFINEDNEEDLFAIFNGKNDYFFQSLLKEFYNKKLKHITYESMPKIKVRSLNPLVDGKRLVNAKLKSSN